MTHRVIILRCRGWSPKLDLARKESLQYQKSLTEIFPSSGLPNLVGRGIVSDVLEFLRIFEFLFIFIRFFLIDFGNGLQFEFPMPLLSHRTVLPLPLVECILLGHALSGKPYSRLQVPLSLQHPPFELRLLKPVLNGTEYAAESGWRLRLTNFGRTDVQGFCKNRLGTIGDGLEQICRLPGRRLTGRKEGEKKESKKERKKERKKEKGKNNALLIKFVETCS